MPSFLVMRNLAPSGLMLVSVKFSFSVARTASAISFGGATYASLVSTTGWPKAGPAMTRSKRARTRRESKCIRGSREGDDFGRIHGRERACKQESPPAKIAGGLRVIDL